MDSTACVLKVVLILAHFKAITLAYYTVYETIESKLVTFPGTFPLKFHDQSRQRCDRRDNSHYNPVNSSCKSKHEFEETNWIICKLRDQRVLVNGTL